MLLLYVDSKIEHLKEIENERVSIDFDNMTGELYMRTLKSEKNIKLSSNVEIKNTGRYSIIKDDYSLFILKDLNEEEII